MGKHDLEEIVNSNYSSRYGKKRGLDSYLIGSLFERDSDLFYDEKIEPIERIYNFSNKYGKNNEEKEIFGKEKYQSLIKENNYNNFENSIEKNLKEIIYNPYQRKYKDSNLSDYSNYNIIPPNKKDEGVSLEALRGYLSRYDDVPKTEAPKPVRPIVVVPASDSDAVVAIFGTNARLLHAESLDQDCRNEGQRIVVARDGQTLESFVKLFDWSQCPDAELGFRRESVLLPSLRQFGINTPEVFGTFERDSTGRIAMRCYDAETFEQKLANLNRDEKMQYLKRIISALVNMQHSVKEHSREILTDIGASLRMDQGTEKYFLGQVQKAMHRLGQTGLNPQYRAASRRLAQNELYPVHQDFTPRNILVTKADDLVITDAEFMSIPGAFRTGGPITMDYSTLMMWPGIELDPMDQIEMDRHFVNEWNNYGNPITMNEFYQVKADTDMIVAKRFAGVYAVLHKNSPTPVNKARLAYFMDKTGESGRILAA